MKHDYIIVCNSRSGSHLLCTLLNSHSKIACTGETDEEMDELKNAQGENIGCIVFNRLFLRGRWKETNKIIHLTRDPLKMAISRYVFNHTSSRPRHSTELIDIRCNLDMNAIKKDAKMITEEEIEIRRILKNCNSIEVSYEEMTNDKNIKELNQKITKKLLDFIDVEYETLTTNLVKPKHIL